MNTLRKWRDNIIDALKTDKSNNGLASIVAGGMETMTVTTPAAIVYIEPRETEEHASGRIYLRSALISILCIPKPTNSLSDTMLSAIELSELVERSLQGVSGIEQRQELLSFFSEKHSDVCGYVLQYKCKYKTHV